MNPYRDTPHVEKTPLEPKTRHALVREILELLRDNCDSGEDCVQVLRACTAFHGYHMRRIPEHP